MNLRTRTYSLSAVLLLLPALLWAQHNKLPDSYYQGVKAFERGDYAQTRSLMLKALEEKPHTAEPHYYLGAILVDQAQDEENPVEKTKLLDQAAGKFNEGLKKNARFAFNYAGLGLVYAMKGDYPNANTQLKKGEEQNPNDVELLILLAEAYIRSKNKEGLKEAEVLLSRAQSKDDKNPAVYTALGDLYFSKNVFELAMSNYQKSVQLDPKFAKGHYRIGVMKITEKKYQEGADAFKKAIEIDPQFGLAYRDLGELYILYGKYELAVQNFKKYLELNPSDLRAKYLYAKSLYSAKQYTEALPIIQAVLKDTSTVVLERLFGYVLADAKRYDEAAAQMDKFFTKAGKQVIVKDYVIYGQCLKGAGKEDAAIANYQKALAMNPGPDDMPANEIWSEIAKIYKARKDYPAAIEAMSKAAAIRPRSEHYEIATLFYQMKNYKACDSSMKLYTAKVSTFPSAYMFLARANMAIDTSFKEGSAVPHFEKVVELCEKDPVKYKNELIESYDGLGFIAYKRKDNNKALGYFKKVVELDPENKNAKEMIVFLEKSGAKAP